MKREYSTYHIHYDPVSGYIHKFRLDPAEDASEPDDAGAAESATELRLMIAGSIAVGLLLAIGLLTL